MSHLKITIQNNNKGQIVFGPQSRQAYVNRSGQLTSMPVMSTSSVDYLTAKMEPSVDYLNHPLSTTTKQSNGSNKPNSTILTHKVTNVLFKKFNSISTVYFKLIKKNIQRQKKQSNSSIRVNSQLQIRIRFYSLYILNHFRVKISQFQTYPNLHSILCKFKTLVFVLYKP